MTANIWQEFNEIYEYSLDLRRVGILKKHDRTKAE